MRKLFLDSPLLQMLAALWLGLIVVGLVACTQQPVGYATPVPTPTPRGIPIEAPITGGTYTYCDPNWPLFGIIGAIVFAVLMAIIIPSFLASSEHSRLLELVAQKNVLERDNASLLEKVTAYEKAREPRNTDIELENERLRKLVEALTKLVEQKGSA